MQRTKNFRWKIFYKLYDAKLFKFFYMPSKMLGVAIVNWNRHTEGRNDFISELDINLIKKEMYKQKKYKVVE